MAAKKKKKLAKKTPMKTTTIKPALALKAPALPKVRERKA